MAKEKQIKIIADEHGNKIRVSANNPEYAHVRLVQDKVWIAPSGWVRKRSVSALLHGKLEHLKEIGIGNREYLSGQLIIKESFTGNDRDLKYAGNTGVLCRVDDQPIYRTTEYDASNTQSDVLISHTNGDEIREANSFDAATSGNKTSIGSGETFFKSKDEVTDPAQTNIIDTIAEVEAEDDKPDEEETEDTKIDKLLQYDEDDEGSEYSTGNIPTTPELEDTDDSEEEELVEVEDEEIPTFDL